MDYFSFGKKTQKSRVASGLMAAVTLILAWPVFLITGTDVALADNLSSKVIVVVLPADPSNLSAAANSQSQINLSWTDNSSNETGFRIERKTGSAEFSEIATVGQDIATYLDGGLSASTAYTYRVRAYNGDGNSGYSNEASATTNSGGGGGGGGGPGPGPVTTVVFSGRAYPKSTVTLLKDAQVSATTIAGADANFQISISNLSAGNYIFSVYSEDNKGIRSSLLTFPVSVTSGATTNVSGIFIAPTIAVDKSEVKRGDDIAIFGQAAPQADMVISVNSEEEFFAKTISDKDGIYLYNFDTANLEYGTHNTKTKASIGNQLVSSWSYSVNFKVGTKNVAAALPTKKAPPKGDLDNNQRVNLVDFSIAAYWYKRPLSAAFKSIEATRLNGDGKVDLIDFSIIAYYWTG